MTARLATPVGRLRVLTVVLCLAVAGILQVLDANPAVSQATSLVAMRIERAPSLDPGDSAWKRAPAVEVALTAQAVTYPFGGGTIPAVRAQAMHDGDTLFVRVVWDDQTEDTSTVAAEDFADAVAVQFPAIAASSAPAICMGQADGGVNIWQWRADSEQPLPDAAGELHADGYVDLYPSTDDLFFPAREAGNPYARPDGPVQDLVAAGFGTLSPATERSVTGKGRRGRDEWAVVFARPFASGDQTRPTFDVGTSTDMALAAWNGDADDRNGQKAISSFLQLSLTAEVLPPAPRGDALVLLTMGGTVGALFVLVLLLSYHLDPTRRRRT